MIYLDNAATSFPKPISVIKSVNECIRVYCANPGRSTHKMALECAERVYSAREQISNFLEFAHPERVIFTQNATHALNIAIKGKIRKKCHIITSDMEHNSVLRPLYSVCRQYGAELSLFDSSLPPEIAIPPLVRSDTEFLITSLASNVTGRTLSPTSLYDVAKKYGLYTIIDASQYLGHKRLSLSICQFDALCAPGHKGLFGIQGSGFVVFKDEEAIEPLMHGGSGNGSYEEMMPEYYPEHFEAGTLNTPAIVSLDAGISYLMDYGMSNAERRITELTAKLYEALNGLGIILYGCENGIASFSHPSMSTSEIARRLDESGIAVRSGLHCAPLIHQKLGCEKGGTVRVSLSIFNTQNDIDALYRALRDIFTK